MAASAARAGIRTALGLPALVLAAAYLGFGSLCRESGLGVWLGIASTVTNWALPGQIAMVELYASGASLFVIALAVALTNARLLPMAVTLLPVVRRAGTPRWRHYLAANFVAATAWAISMQRCPGLPRAGRLAFFLGLGIGLWLVSVAATAAGFLIAGLLPRSVSLGLVFINPLYFTLLFMADLRRRARALALVFGAVAGPLLQPLAQEWGLLATGLLAGTAAYLVNRWLPRREAAGHVAPDAAEADAEADG
ncbi:MAG: AzlC family ABC transporter permease [Rhodospirillaceae bacterium]|nr:AzlC family ABC transporter permease [Rhodospirillaceae bacterium]